MTITAPSQTGPSNTYIYPSTDAAGTLYIAFASFPQNRKTSTATLHVSHSSDDGQTFAPFAAAATAGVLPAGVLPNTTFRDGITENFTASPAYPGHLYLTYEDWNGTKMNVKFTQSTDGGRAWSKPVTVNDNVDAPGALQGPRPAGLERCRASRHSCRGCLSSGPGAGRSVRVLGPDCQLHQQHRRVPDAASRIGGSRLPRD